MTQQSNLKSLFLKACLLLGVVVCGSFLRANSDQTPVVLGFSHRVAIETLFRYCAMEKNPYYLEREKRTVQQEERLRKILEKRGQDLTPLQQIELLKHTFDLRFADSLVAQTLKAFMLSWALQAGAEGLWRKHCLQKGLFEAVPNFKIKEVKSPRIAPLSAGRAFVPKGFNEEVSYLLGKPGAVETISAGARNAFSRIVNLQSPKLARSAEDEVDSEEVLNLLLDSQSDSEDNESSNKLPLARKKFKLQINDDLTFHAKPAKLERLLFVLNYGVKLAPLLMIVGKQLMRYFTNNDKTAEAFLDGVFKNFSSEYVAGFGSTDHKNYLLEVLINPLWKKHNGREEDVCVELAQLGEKLRTLEGALAAGSSKQKILYSLVMGVHGGVLPFEHAKLPQRINQAFEQGIVNRALKSGIFTGFVIGVRTLFRALRARHLAENFSGAKHDYLVMYCALFTYWTLKECANKIWYYDNSQARKDYDVFIQRLELQKQEQYRESFYWGWFYPMWRTHKRDVLEVEACFLKRVEEVKKLFEARVEA